MLRLLIVAGPPENGSLDDFNFQWGIVDVALALTTPSSMQSIRRYTQSRVVPLPDGGALARPPQSWQYCCTDQLYDDLGSFGAAATHPDYFRRIVPHAFGGSRTLVQLAEHAVQLADRSPAGGRPPIKLLSFVRRSADVSIERFREAWLSRLDPVQEEALDCGLLRAVSRSVAFDVDRGLFAATPFADGSINDYDGVEDLHFDDFAALIEYISRIRALTDGPNAVVDTGRSVTLPMKERMVFDQTRGGPRPAILDADSFEASVYATEPQDGRW